MEKKKKKNIIESMKEIPDSPLPMVSPLGDGEDIIDIGDIIGNGDIIDNGGQVCTRVKKIQLTEKQSAVRQQIFDFIQSDEQFGLLIGYAGTGKTTLITDICKSLRTHGIRVFGKFIPYTVVSAPTNKAVKVLRYKLEESNSLVSAKTVHSLLAIKPKINYMTGEEDFVPDKYAEKTILDYNFWIIDECSMVNKKLLDIITDELRLMHIKVLFVGDDKQLPPVNEDLSMTFTTKPVFKLDEVLRYGGIISKFATFIRKNNEKRIVIPNLKNKDENGNGIHTIPRFEFKEKIKEYFTGENYTKNPDFCRVLAYTNDQTNYWNSYIRDLIYGIGIPSFVCGDRLIADEAIFSDYTIKGGNIILGNSEEVIVTNAIWKEDGNVSQYKIPHWELKCTNVETNDKVELRVLDKARMKEYNTLLNNFSDSKNWKDFYFIKKYFHPMKYAHAMTVHKSQGSTIQNVFVDNVDIFIERKKVPILVRNQLFYVAVTRASDNVFLIKSK